MLIAHQSWLIKVFIPLIESAEELKKFGDLVRVCGHWNFRYSQKLKTFKRKREDNLCISDDCFR